jgi:CubicO group peptidase (beta-lactamase class C family)
MKSQLKSDCLFLFLSVSASAPAGAQTVEIDRSVQDIARTELLHRSAPGAVIALVNGDNPIAVSAIGHADLDRRTPMLPDRLFGTGGFEDVLTALTTVLLAESGHIALDVPIRTYASDLPPRIGALTIAQLLSHTAGLDDAEDEVPRRGRRASTVWPGATDRALFTEPGSIYSPSRHGYPLVRALLANKTQRLFDVMLRELVLEPAGMQRSTFDGSQAEMLGGANGHLFVNTDEGPARTLSPAQSPQRQLYTSAEDIARLLQHWMRSADRIWSTSAVETLSAARAVRPANPADSVAFSPHVTRFRGMRQLSYVGSIAGYATLLRWIPDARVGVVILTNATGAVLHETADAALALALPAPVPEPATAPDVRGFEDSALYAGTYGNGERIVVLEMNAGQLHWRDGDVLLPVQREGSRLDVMIPDGRVAQVLHVYHDAAGTAYLLVGDRAYRRTP